MSFSVSFVFKATDSYSKALKHMADTTAKLGKALASIGKLSTATKNKLESLGTMSTAVGNKFTATSKKLNTFTAAMQGATNATMNQRLAMKSLGYMRINVPRNTTAKKPPGFWGRKGFSQKWADAAPSMITAGGVLAAPLAYGFNKIREFEQGWAAVRKVVRDEYGDSGLEDLKRQVMQIAATSPMATAGILDIVQAAGQAGIAKQDMVAFTQMSIQAAGAFDMTSEEISESFTKIHQEFGLNMKQMETFGDAVNQLDNMMASKARDILINTMNVGGLAAAMKMRAQDAAAVISTLQDIGVRPLQSDHTFTYMYRALQAPENLPDKRAAHMATFLNGMKAPKTDKEAMKILSTFGNKMRTKPVETTMEFLKMLNATGKNIAVIAPSIFGNDQQISGIINLAKHTERLGFAFKIVNGEVGKLTGSMKREFEEKTKTINASMQIMANRIGIFFSRVWDNIDKDHELAKIFRGMAVALDIVLTKVENFTKAHPKLTLAMIALVGVVALALIGLGALGFVLGGVNALITLFSFQVGGAAIGVTMWNAIVVGLTATISFLCSWVGVLVGVLVVAFVVAYNKFEPFRNCVNALINLLRSGLFFALKLVQFGFHILANSIQTAWDNLKGMINTVRNNPMIKPFIDGAIGLVTNVYNGTTDLMNKGSGYMDFYGNAMDMAMSADDAKKQKNASFLNKLPNVKVPATSMLPTNFMPSKIQVAPIKIEDIKSKVNIDIRMLADGSFRIEKSSSTSNTTAKANVGTNMVTRK